MSVETNMVSIITVVYNGVDILESTLLSVINQSYTNIEYIVIDGGSNDGTVDIIKKYSKSISYWTSENDHGIYDAMNKGIKKANGEWILFMNAGDRIYNNTTIENIFSFNNIGSTTGVIYGDTIINSTVGTFYSKSNNPFFKMHSYIKSKGVCHQSTLVRARLAIKYCFDTDFLISADFKMLYEIFIDGYDFQYFEDPFCYYLVDEGASKKRQRLAWYEDAKVIGINDEIRFKLWYYFKTVLSINKEFLSKIIKGIMPQLHSYIKERRLSSRH